MDGDEADVLLRFDSTLRLRGFEAEACEMRRGLGRW